MPEQTSDDYQIERKGEIILLRLTRPAELNAITRATLDGIEMCCEALDSGQARALIVTGEGERAFCSGTDL